MQLRLQRKPRECSIEVECRTRLGDGRYPDVEAAVIVSPLLSSEPNHLNG
jgi:hypothetical protein